jgi:hypothetical protein
MDAVRTFNKRILNRGMVKLAGREHWYAAALHHVGNKSGRKYITPVVADTIDGGFLVPLPYGSGVDWLRNLRASGTATLVDHGRTFTVSDPEVLTAEQALTYCAPRRAAFWRLVRMREFLKLTAVAS